MRLIKILHNFCLYFHVFGFSNAIQVILKTRLFRRNEIELKLSQLKHPIYLRNRKSDIETFNQIFLYEDYAVFFEELPKTIVDAGANIGLSGAFFANKFPNAQIISIEPENNNFKFFTKNTAFYPEITGIQAALSNESGVELSVIDAGFGDWGFITKIGENEDVEKNKILTITINDLINQYNWTSVDLVKIDIEGFEKEVFANNYNWLEKTKVLIMELHDRMIAGSSQPFFRAISQYNFSYEQRGENLIFRNMDFYKN